MFNCSNNKNMAPMCVSIIFLLYELGKFVRIKSLAL